MPKFREMEDYNEIVSYLKSGKYPKNIKDQSNWKKKCKNYELKENKLYYNHKKYGQLDVVKTKNRVQKILQKVHHKNESHLGINKMREHIVSKYYWKGIQDYVSEFVKKCEKCRSDQEQKNTTSKINHEVSLIASSWEKESKMDAKVNRNLSFQKFNLSVYMDILGPLIRTKKKNLYCVVLTNNDTKWAEGFPLSEIDTEVITGFIYEFICRHGYPMQLLVSPLSCLDVDNFHTKLETDMNNRIQKGLFHINVDPTVVIFNEEIKKLLNTFITSLPLLKNKWDDHLPALMLYYNSFPNPTDSPYFKTYNKHFIPSTGGISNEENKLWLWTKAILEEFQSNLDYENEQAPPL